MIDIAGALNRMGGDRALLLDMAGFFLQDAPALLHTIQRNRIGDEATRAAHSLRGLAANFGATSVMQAAAKIEDVTATTEARDQAVTELERLLPRLLRELETLRD
jgi:two-component system, sensor histidine kinase and response regulator